MAKAQTRKPRRHYVYVGAVLRYGRPGISGWRTHTIAASEAQAKTNLKHQAAMKLGLVPGVCLTLDGKITPGNEVFN